MKPSIKRKILSISVFTVVVFTGWLSYDLYFRQVLNNYERSARQQEMIENFEANKEAFNDFSRDATSLSIQRFSLFEHDSIELELASEMHDNSGIRTVHIGKLPYEKIDVVYLNDSGHLVQVRGLDTFQDKRWHFIFHGKLDHSHLNRVFPIRKINREALKALKREMVQLDCHEYSWTPNSVTLRYAGHWGESLEYVFVHESSEIDSAWNKLGGNIYWSHRRNGLFCGRTDW